MSDDRLNTRHHAVQFYGDDATLFTTVGGFLGEGLVAGHPAVIIASTRHRDAILAELSARLIDVESAQAAGRLVLLDAAEALEGFMPYGTPDAELFERNIGSVFSKLLAGRDRTIVRAYGEMVDVLWKEGHADAAIRVEMLWNKLSATYGFALLCGYAIGSFYKQAEHFRAVCDQHTHVVSPDPHVVPFRRKRTRRTA